MKLFKYTAVAAALTLAFPAFAGTGSGLVRTIMPIANGVVVFVLDNHPGVPACDKFINQFEFDASTTQGKNQLAVLIAAANGKKRVNAVGSGACSTGQGRETVLYFSVDY